MSTSSRTNELEEPVPAEDRRGNDPAFSVDTHLFRELGELLVGRDSTALIELLKNAYDADANVTSVSGALLGTPVDGTITITDDGVGMTEREFREGFLRIASRTKSTETRRSLLHQRRYTGAKGVGRLAAHKLARLVEVSSVPHRLKRDSESKEEPYRIVASINWDEVERYETLDQASQAIAFRREAVEDDVSGTVVALRRLRRAWTGLERLRFFDELSSFQPPPLLVARLPPSLAKRRLLFSRPRVRDAGPTGMTIDLEGELRSGDDPASQFGGLASWVLEVDAGKDVVKYGVAPTQRLIGELGHEPEGQSFKLSRNGDRDGLVSRLEFQARVLIATTQPPAALRETLRRTSGVRVYMEGFRVLPYGEPGDDWLEIQRSYVTRSRTLDLEQGIGEGAKDEGLVRTPVDQVFGAVFLTEERAPDLQMLVNREGFVPGAAFEDLRTLLKRAIDLTTRVRAQATAERRAERAQGRRRASFDRVVRDRAAAERLQEGLRDADRAARGAEDALSTGDTATAANLLAGLTASLSSSRAASDELISEAAMQRALASLGTQMAEFVHELNAILGSANALDELARDLQHGDQPSRGRLREVADAIADLRLALERQAVLLVDVVTPDARRRRSRQRLAERFDAAARFVAEPAARSAITILNEIPPDLRSPPMFPAELSTVFTNLLTNAVKAAGEGGVVRGTAQRDADGVQLRVENTGTAVDAAEGERWFAAFASTTADVDAVLGQGMGLGLTLTRAMLSPYGATVAFVVASEGFSSGVLVTFPS